MSNEFLEAARNSDDSSEERYERAKKEEAGTEHQSMAEKRYEELKEEAKREFVEKQIKKEQEEQGEDDSDDSSDGNFITH